MHLKQHWLIIAFIIVGSVVAGILLSGISFIGRAGISVLYTEFSFLKVWWQGAALVFCVWLFLLNTLAVVRRRIPTRPAGVVVLLFFLMGLVGFYTSYHDFNHTLSHKMLGSGFHNGVYLFWVGWVAITLYSVFGNRPANNTDVPANSLQ